MQRMDQTACKVGSEEPEVGASPASAPTAVSSITKIDWGAKVKKTFGWLRAIGFINLKQHKRIH